MLFFSSTFYYIQVTQQLIISHCESKTVHCACQIVTSIQCSRTVILSNKFIVKLSAIYWLTQVVLEKRPLNRCSSRSSYQQYRLHQILFMQKPVPLIPRTITEQVFGFLISWLLNISCPTICFFHIVVTVLWNIWHLLDYWWPMTRLLWPLFMHFTGIISLCVCCVH